jgi:hypothetical protein
MMRSNAAVHESALVSMVRYGFNIRTKSGQRVDNIQIMAASVGDAERRLRQMYRQCEIIDRREQSVPDRIADLQHGGNRARIVASRGKAGTQ